MAAGSLEKTKKNRQKAREAQKQKEQRKDRQENDEAEDKITGKREWQNQDINEQVKKEM